MAHLDNAAIRLRLHQFIDNTDDKRVEALYTLLQNDLGPSYVFTEDEISMLHERAEKYQKGGGTTYTVEESHSSIRQQSKKK